MLGVCSNEGSWEVECPIILCTYVPVAVPFSFFCCCGRCFGANGLLLRISPFWEVTLVQTICCVVGQPNSSRDLRPNITSYMVRRS